MKLALKLAAAFLFCGAVLATVHAWLVIERQTQAFEAQARADARNLAGSLENQIARAWHEDGADGLSSVLRNTAGYSMTTRVRWVWLDARPGTPDGPVISPDRLQAVVVERLISIPAQGTDGNRHLISYYPISLDSSRKGALEVTRPMTELEESKREIIWQTIQLVVSMLVLTGGVAVVLGVRMVGRPLNQLIEKTRRMASGDLSRPIHLGTGDELAQLGESLNEMCDALASSEEKVREEAAARTAVMTQLRHADRLKTVGRLASGMAHELGTPLNVVSGRAGLIASGKLSEEEIARSAVAIQAEANRMTAIIRQLLDFARRNTPHRIRTELWRVVEDTCELLSPLAQKQKVSIDLPEERAPAPAMVDPAQLQQVLTNLLVNAIQAMPDGGGVRVGIEACGAMPPDGSQASPGEFFRIDVEDEGTGIAAEEMDQLFEPFFTTKEVGQGTGLGLSIAYGIVQEHGGWIAVRSRPGEGSCFSVYLPKEPEA
ncbi:MAG: sensor histidine kinase [Thermoguttaceae bacterium]